jgi:hypothetical protein
MSDEEFDKLIGYCRIHCRTERALFHRNDVNQVLELAGRPERVRCGDFIAVHDEMSELCDMAVARRREAKADARRRDEWDRRLAAIDHLFCE